MRRMFAILLVVTLPTLAHASHRELVQIGLAVEERYGVYYSTGTYGHIQRLEVDFGAGVATVEWHHECLGTPRTMCARLASVTREASGRWQVRELRRWTVGPIPPRADPWRL